MLNLGKKSASPELFRQALGEVLSSYGVYAQGMAELGAGTEAPSELSEALEKFKNMKPETNYKKVHQALLGIIENQVMAMRYLAEAQSKLELESKSAASSLDLKNLESSMRATYSGSTKAYQIGQKYQALMNKNGQLLEQALSALAYDDDVRAAIEQEFSLR